MEPYVPEGRKRMKGQSSPVAEKLESKKVETYLHPQSCPILEAQFVQVAANIVISASSANFVRFAAEFLQRQGSQEGGKKRALELVWSGSIHSKGS